MDDGEKHSCETIRSLESPTSGILDEEASKAPLIAARDAMYTTSRRERRLTCVVYALGLAYVVTVLVFLSFYLYTRHGVPQCRQLDLFPSLAAHSIVVQHRRTKLPVDLKSTFVGDPSPELDHAWHGLFEDVAFRVTPEDMRQTQLTSLQLNDGSGDFVGQLGVHHELHCLKRVRRWIYRDYYYPNLTEPAYTENKVHIDHCIEQLRMAAMCRADTSLSTFEYLNTDTSAVTTTKDEAYHSCVNYDRLMKWVRARSVDLFDPNTLVPPA